LPLRGSTQQLIDACALYKEQGVDTLSMVLEPCTAASLEAIAPVLAAL
jgi:hypothetical protein